MGQTFTPNIIPIAGISTTTGTTIRTTIGAGIMRAAVIGTAEFGLRFERSVDHSSQTGRLTSRPFCCALRSLEISSCDGCSAAILVKIRCGRREWSYPGLTFVPVDFKRAGVPMPDAKHKESVMAAKGVYRTSLPDSGGEFASVDYGVASSGGWMTRADYEARKYQPPFDNLPTKEQYDAAKPADVRHTQRP
jgi:hypothetical protein